MGSGRGSRNAPSPIENCNILSPFISQTDQEKAARKVLSALKYSVRLIFAIKLLTLAIFEAKLS